MKSFSTKLLVMICLSLAACNQSSNSGTEQSTAATPVTVIAVDSVLLQEKITLTATSQFLLKTFIKANMNGYIKVSNIKVGDVISRGQTLFIIKTKEAESLGNTISQLDPSFNFSGTNRIKSQVSGYITQLNHQAGDYVQDGEALAQIADKSSFGFIMNLPYEYNQLLTKNKSVDLILPDGRTLNGSITQIMPSVDSLSQTQKVLIKVADAANIPENLIAKVILIDKTALHPSLPKEAVLTDESQQHFWVMKLLNDSTAVKVPVTKGLETSTRVEILTPGFTARDRILISGNYGLGDTAKVSVKNK